MSEAAQSREGKYLTFVLGDEEYGFAITGVKEIIGIMPVTGIPKTPQFVKGVINLRGRVIPIVDLRLKIGLAEIEPTETTCIIVVETAQGHATIATGVVVDGVKEVCLIPESEIEETPSFGVNLDTAYILGMAKNDRGVRILLDVDKVLGAAGLAAPQMAA